MISEILINFLGEIFTWIWKTFLGILMANHPN